MPCVIWRQTAGGDGTPWLIEGVFKNGLGETLVGEVKDPEVLPCPDDRFQEVGSELEGTYNCTRTPYIC